MRPDDVNVPLTLHVLGAGLLVGTLIAVATAILIGWRSTADGDAVGLTRFGLRTLLLGVFPAYLLMRIGAQWTEAEEDFPDDFEPAWLGIGYITADLGALLVLISIILAAIGLRRSRDGGAGSVRFARIIGVICMLLLAAYVVAVWAMTAKPT